MAEIPERARKPDAKSTKWSKYGNGSKYRADLPKTGPARGKKGGPLQNPESRRGDPCANIDCRIQKGMIQKSGLDEQGFLPQLALIKISCRIQKGGPFALDRFRVWAFPSLKCLTGGWQRRVRTATLISSANALTPKSLQSSFFTFG